MLIGATAAEAASWVLHDEDDDARPLGSTTHDDRCFLIPATVVPPKALARGTKATVIDDNSDRQQRHTPTEDDAFIRSGWRADIMM